MRSIAASTASGRFKLSSTGEATMGSGFQRLKSGLAVM